MNPQAQQFQPTYPVNDPMQGCPCPHCQMQQSHMPAGPMPEDQIFDPAMTSDEEQIPMHPMFDAPDMYPGAQIPMHPDQMIDQDISIDHFDVNFNFGPMHHDPMMGGHPAMGMPMHDETAFNPAMMNHDDSEFTENMPGMQPPHMFMPEEMESMHHDPMMYGHPAMGMPMHPMDGVQGMYPEAEIPDMMPMSHGFHNGGHPGFDNQMMHPQQFGHPFPHGPQGPVMSGATKTFSRG